MELLSEAICFAARAFDGARRKGDGAPAALHAMEAACIAATLTREEAALAAAALHDTVEDAGVTREELAERFGERVAALVMSDTEDKMRQLPPSQTWRARKEATVERMRRSADPGEAAVCLADKLSNMRSIYRGTRERGADFWLAFSQRDPEQHHWYYRGIASALEAYADTAAWREYDRLIRETFGEDDAAESGGRI